MSQEKRLGRIRSASFGKGGYDEAMFGFSVSLGDGSWGCGDFVGTWSEYPPHAKYSAESWRDGHMEAVLRLRDTLKEAKKSSVEQLVGTPVEVTFDGMRMTSWRVLTEVL